MKRPVRRTSRSFLPLMLLLWGGVVWGMVGCGLMTGFSGGGDALSREQMALALTALKQGDTRAADLALARAAASLSEPGQAPGRAISQVGAMLIRSGDGVAGARFLKTASAEPETSWDPLVWSALADAYRSANNPNEAAAAKAEADRRGADILGMIGRPETGRDNGAGQRLLEAGLYYASADRNDIPAALRALREANRLLPDDPEVMNALGYTLADHGTTGTDWDDAKILTRSAAQLRPDNSNIMDSYGWALFKRGELAGARRVLSGVADALSEEPVYHFHMGSVYAALGQADDARVELSHALQIDPQFENASQARELLGKLTR